MSAAAQAPEVDLDDASGVGPEVAVTAKWTARRGQSSSALAQAATAANRRDDVLASEVLDVIGADAVLVHQVFADADALSSFEAAEDDALSSLATQGQRLVRGATVPDPAGDATVSGDWIFGFLKPTDATLDPETAIQVTAKWTCAPDDDATLDQLEYWWRRVATEAYTLEDGLVRFESYRVRGEDALIIHETFSDTKELKFHLTKGTAAMFKKDIDRIAAPETYYFRGPVSWMIRTYSKFMRLPATYTR